MPLLECFRLSYLDRRTEPSSMATVIDFINCCNVNLASKCMINVTTELGYNMESTKESENQLKWLFTTIYNKHILLGRPIDFTLSVCFHDHFFQGKDINIWDNTSYTKQLTQNGIQMLKDWWQQQKENFNKIKDKIFWQIFKDIDNSYCQPIVNSCYFEPLVKPIIQCKFSDEEPNRLDYYAQFKVCNAH